MIGSKTQPVCITGNLTIVVPGTISKLQSTSLVEQVANYNILMSIILNRCLVSTAESVQLCYTNQYGVVVIVGVVVVVGMVKFFSFDVSIQFLPLVRIVWIKECLITTDSYWRLHFRCWWWKKQIIL